MGRLLLIRFVLLGVLCSVSRVALAADPVAPSEASEDSVVPARTIVGLSWSDGKVTFTDSEGGQWCYRVSPSWGLVWHTSKTSTEFGGDQTWSMESDVVVDALRASTPVEVIDKLSGGLHPTQQERQQARQAGPVVNGAPDIGTKVSKPKARLPREGVRVNYGACLGIEVGCPLIGGFVDVSGEALGFKLGAAGPFPAGFAQVRVYFVFRSYFYGGVTHFLDLPIVGGGFGWDISLPGLPLRVQPQVGYTNALDLAEWPGGSISFVFER